MDSYAAAGLRHLALCSSTSCRHAVGDPRVRPSAETIALYERLRRPELAHIAELARGEYGPGYDRLPHLTCTSQPGGLLWECEVDGCGRRLVIDRDRGELVVIDRGDPYALHRGSIGGVALP